MVRNFSLVLLPRGYRHLVRKHAFLFGLNYRLREQANSVYIKRKILWLRISICRLAVSQYRREQIDFNTICLLHKQTSFVGRKKPLFGNAIPIYIWPGLCGHAHFAMNQLPLCKLSATATNPMVLRKSLRLLTRTTPSSLPTALNICPNFLG